MIKIYRVTGKVKGQKFSVDFSSVDEKHVLEKVYSNLGSRFGVKRNQIEIEKIEEISVEETKNRVVKQLHGRD